MSQPHPTGEVTTSTRRSFVIVLGVVLLIIGFIAKVAIIWTLGIIAIVIGAVLFILGTMGREIAGRKHWY